MKVLVTGAAGYIGSALTPLLRDAGFDAALCDAGWFSAAHVGPARARMVDFEDFTRLGEADLRPFDAVIHLAAYSNDPLGSLAPGATARLNDTEAVAFAARAKAAGVRVFVFASSCSVYGDSGAATKDETSSVAPLTAYAKAKHGAEAGMMALRDEAFRVAILRGATAFGFSQCPRVDLLLNEFAAFAALDQPLTLRSDGSSWRPFMPIEDFARALIAAATRAPRDDARPPVWNIAPPGMQMTVAEAVTRAAKAVGAPPPVLGDNAPVDLRSYRVVGDAFARDFPEFRYSADFERHIRTAVDGFRKIGDLREDLASGRFVRLEMLRQRPPGAARRRATHAG